MSLLLLLFAPAAGADPCALDGAVPLEGEEPEGLGGTGLREGRPLAGGDSDSGLGGTGLGDEAEGLGGTGLGGEPDGLGGTGVVGTITGFGSICVNGLRIAYDPHTPTEVNLAPGSAEGLQVGQVVAVQAHEVEGELRARSIAVRQLVRGPLDGVDPRARRLRVLGQDVELPEAWADDALAVLAQGDPLAISGQRASDGRILATRLTILERPDVPSLIGPLAIDSDGVTRVAGVRVVLEDPVDPALEGDSVIATGAWNPEAGRIEHAEIARAVAFDARTAEVSVAGYVEARHDGVVRVGGLRVEALRTFRDRLQLDDYVIVRGVPMRGGAIRALRIARDVRPPRHMLPRPPRLQRPPDVPRPPPRPPSIDAVRPARPHKLMRP
jgi:hypothetical protein